MCKKVETVPLTGLGLITASSEEKASKEAFDNLGSPAKDVKSEEKVCHCIILGIVETL